ncbi:MAG: phospholipid carrier-dependent glycosyltransferase [Pseudomonadota bacterium]
MPDGLMNKAITAGRSHLVAVTVLILLGALLRLPWLAEPPNVVFDEVHFGKYASGYCCSHERFFDIHPPHAKLLIAGAAYAGGYRGGFSFNNIGQAYPEDVPVFYLRLIPAIAGILLPIALFAVMRLVGASLAAAFAAGFLICLDNAIWVQTRMIALDGVLWLSMLASIACLLKAQRIGSMRGRIGWLILCGIFMGLAIGTKITGLTTGVVALALMANELLERRTGLNTLIFFRQGVWILAPCVLIYMAGWALHFALLTEPGPGDSFYRPTGEFMQDVVMQHSVMLGANVGLTAGHSDASPWWSWPFMAVPLFYWAQAERVIYFVGNPVVWWGSTAIVVTALMVLLLQPLTRLRLPVLSDPGASSDQLPAGETDLSGTSSGSLIFRVSGIGLVISFLPLADVSRSLFLYHYVPTLFFALMLAIAWLERCGWTEAGKSPFRQPLRYWGVLLGAVIGFVLMLPLTGGLASFAWWRSLLFGLFPLWP